MKKLLNLLTASILTLSAGFSFANPDYASSKYSYITLDGQTHAVLKDEAATEKKRLEISNNSKSVEPQIPHYAQFINNKTKKLTQEQEERENFHNGGKRKEVSQDPVQMALGKAGSVASDKAEELLNKFGSARVMMNGNSKFKTGSVDVLVPLHNFTEKDKSLVFAQFGGRRSNYLTEQFRTTVNLGLGYRYFADNNWMYGINAFLDSDVTRGHQRMGMGVEAWTDNFKFSANTYRRLTDWQDSPDLKGYQERPANGFDIRAEGALPSLPQLSGKVVYEKYYGNEVGLFGQNRRQSDPSAVTVALNYKPVPLLSIGVEHRSGQGGHSENRINIALNYKIGVPLSKQLNPSSVSETRKLSSTRTDIVERNNEIVLEYQIKPIGNIRLPNLVNGNPTSVISFPISIVTNTALSNFIWTGSGAAFMSPYNDGSASGEITLPIYSTTSSNTYTLQLTAKDIHGRLIQSNVLTIVVDGYTLTITPSKSVANADGVDTVTFTARLVDKNGVPVVNQPITWAARNSTIQSSQPTTNVNGEAQVVVTSNIAGIAEVDAVYALQNLIARGNTEFRNPTIGVYSIVSQHTSILADGTSVTTLTANVRDSNGNIVGAGFPVTWTTSAGTLLGSVTNTDANGNAIITLRSDTMPSIANIWARASAQDSGRNTNVQFTAPTPPVISVFSIVSQHTTINADGTSTTVLTANVRDNNGNIVVGHAVTWATSLGTLSGATSTTDSGGNAVITLTSSTSAGMANVSARASVQDAGRNANVEFVAPPPVTINVFSIVSEHTSIAADGTSTTILTANVRDSNGNIVANHPVTWTASLGTLSGSTSNTDSNGNAVITLTSVTTPGVSNVLARANAQDAGRSTPVTFAAGAPVIMVNILSGPTSIQVSNTANAPLTAEVTDQYGNRLGAGHVVTWTQTSPSGSLQHATSVTDANGIATNVFTTGTTVGSATINASAGGTAPKTLTIRLLADESSARIIDLMPSLLNSEANNETEIYFFVTIADQYGNRFAGDQEVTAHWTTEIGFLSQTESKLSGNLSRAGILLRASNYSGMGTLRVHLGNGDPGMTSAITYAKVDDDRQDNENYIEFYNCGSPTFDTTQATYLVWDGKVVANGLVQLPYTDALGYTYSYYGDLKNDTQSGSMTCNGNQTGYRATSGVNRVSR